MVWCFAWAGVVLEVDQVESQSERESESEISPQFGSIS